MSNAAAHWAELSHRTAELDQLSYLQGVVGWDQQTYMPSGSSASRGDHMAFLSRLSHERLTDPALQDCLNALHDEAEGLSPSQRAGVRRLRRASLRQAALPSALVERIARLESEGFTAWMAAREAGDFGVLEPALTEMVKAIREKASAEAEAVSATTPYEALVDLYDPTVTVAYLDGMFARLREGLALLLDGIRGAAQLPALEGPHAEGPQLGLSQKVAAALGFNLQQGRIDLAAHPFTVTLGASDVRITTRLREDDILDMLGSTIHEVGHALYEQGMPRGKPGISEAASTGLHESQSRFWENVIGRSAAFLTWLRGPWTDAYGEAPVLETLVHAANRVEPGFIRVAADEVTYNLHVALRYDLESQLFAAQQPLAVADLPEAWNAAMLRDLGLTVTDPRHGVLQDVHWPSGGFGYFPSYTLGNIYAASLAKRINADLPSMWEQVERGEFAEILGWLRTHIHERGAELEAPDLVASLTPGQDPVADLLDHLWDRHGALYNVTRTPS